MKIAYLTVAREEIREAAEYYAAISPELGNAFKRELRQLLRRVGGHAAGVAALWRQWRRSSQVFAVPLSLYGDLRPFAG